MSKILKILITFVLISTFTLFIVVLWVYLDKDPQDFNGQRAFEDVKYQVELGPRILGSDAHTETENWIVSKLRESNWEVVTQESVISGVTVKNIIAKRGTGESWIIIGSHYDSRLYADRDSDIGNRKQPVVGANDGASTVAILLELARILPIRLDKQIWLVFFDAEDNGDILGYEWSIGSQYFVAELQGKPDDVIILDMLGDKDLNIYMERNSNPDLNQEIWGVASQLSYSQFRLAYKHQLIDDHLPFIQAGIKAVDIIDYDYPYWHTTHDTLDKISSDSLEVVGETILKWLVQYPK